MKSKLYATAAAVALCAGAAQADGHLSGVNITVAGTWLSPEAEIVNEIFDLFEARTGANVSYVGSDSFEQQVIIDAEAGSAANISVFPQPGLAADLARRGFLTPLEEGSAEWIAENYAAGQSWVDLGTYADQNGDPQLYGMFFRVDLKSLVWYSPENFEDAGYEIPQTMEELKTLTDQIVADGGTPWCIGLGSGAATGWPATDWVEDMMLRTQPPEIYDAWVTNDLPFDSPEVIAAIDEFGAFARNDAYVAGGAGAVATTDFRDSPKGMFSSPPQCYMHRQASFIPAFFPEGTEIGEDVDFFYFPAYEGKDLGSPVLGAGTLFAITNPGPGAQELIAFLREPEAHEIWMSYGGFLTPHKGVDMSKFIDDTSRGLNDILLNATTFRFDGSDLMPGAIGAGAFWTGMVDYAGGKPAAEVAKGVQDSWDAIK
ncbi:ABC transporter substrate-binding protein [Yoonia sp.]|uniref:ABC transporter substrate-binding protein n=1 Tax=Yoonia sp. TaxID=2212373 RepID=UPI0019DCF70A|nr:ABC transporter substrate-binding protein [Yoonia sp.]MBE0414674.1 carbohydrate ABC transporter substrate-binding protein [Yoonia sp.]